MGAKSDPDIGDFRTRFWAPIYAPDMNTGPPELLRILRTEFVRLV